MPHPNVVARQLDESIVLVHLDTSRIFTLNTTGSRIWELLSADARNGDVPTLERMLREHYDVQDEEQLHGDLVALLGELERERLVVAAGGDGP